MRVLSTLVLTILFFFTSDARAEFYRWVDKDGTEFFSNDQKQVPPAYRGSATIVRPDDRRISVGNKAAAPARNVRSDDRHKDKYGRGEEYWRQKATNLRLKLRNQQDEYDIVMKQLDAQEQSKSRGKKKKSAAGLEKKKMKLEKEMAQTTRMLEVDLPEEARRADAYPGWLRE